MTTPIGWAKEPMIRRVSQLPVGMPMSLLYGSRSWVDSGVGWQVKFSRTDSYVDVQVRRGFCEGESECDCNVSNFNINNCNISKTITVTSITVTSISVTLR